MLRIENLTKIYRDQKNENRVLNNVNLEIRRREFVCILGPSGCGKTTLLRCVAGFEDYEGRVLIDGVEKSMPGTDRIMVFQDFNQLFPWKNVAQNIKLPLKIKGVKDKKELDRKTTEALKKVGLSGYEEYYPFQLSGGMKQRAAIAKAIALNAEVILMDEPFAALDAITRRNCQCELQKIAKEEQSTFIFITHNIQESIVLGSRILVLSENGNIKIDINNNLQKPVFPSSEGYGEMWENLNSALTGEI